MKFTKNDNRKEMSNFQASVLTVVGLGAMMVIGGFPIGAIVGGMGLIGCGCAFVANNKK